LCTNRKILIHVVILLRPACSKACWWHHSGFPAAKGLLGACTDGAKFLSSPAKLYPEVQLPALAKRYGEYPTVDQESQEPYKPQS
jgi:hypothetical protein